MPWPPYLLEKKLLIPIGKRLSDSRTLLNAVKKRNFLSLLGIETQFLSHPTDSLVAVPIEL
jgi:hypothetical protein